MKGHIRERRPGVWQVLYDAAPDPVTGRRRQRSRTVRGSRADAEILLRDINSELDQGTWVDDGSIRIAELVELFLTNRGPRLKPSAADSYRRKLKYVTASLGHRKASQVNGGTLTALYRRLLDQGLSGSTVYGVHASARAMFRAAVKWGYLRSDPTARAEPPSKATREPTTWSAADIRRFLDSTREDQWHVAWLICAMTGLRRGELCGLEWTKVDLEAGTVTITKAIGVVAGQMVEGEPKTRSSRRTISIDSLTVELLDAYRDRGGVRRIGRVITWPTGEPVHPDILSKAFRRSSDRLGLPRIRLHDLRHGWATLALEAGVHIRVVADRLGHATPSVTLNVYSHATQRADREAAELVASRIRGPRAGNMTGNVTPLTGSPSG